ncbi:MAG: HPF/RaiA family ribosome-associated protein, partial [Planctomycetota bacterium]
KVRRVVVQLTDVNGPRGGRDVRCTIRARLTTGGELVVQELHDSPFSAAAGASDRMARGLARRIERLHQRWRGRA